MCPTEGILITGGYDTGTIVEVIFGNGTHCTLPSLPHGRIWHSQSGLTACGGSDSPARETCTTFSSGAWATSHNLMEKRLRHVSWNSPTGIMLLGGLGSEQTTELLSSTSTSAQFDLPYDIK